jgi:hypothetical protein
MRSVPLRRPTSIAPIASPGFIENLEPFVGLWHMSASLPTGGEPPHAETSFEWLEGGQFLIQRWRVDHPAAPDGIAIIGASEAEGAYRQHYFDSRGVARVYEMTFTDGVWKLWRNAGFSQRFTGTFDSAGDTISGTWEASRDGSTWEHDFDLTYTPVSR